MTTVLELCAGGGGQALGLEQAGMDPVGTVEIERDACDTLLANRPRWRVIHGDIREIDGSQFRGVDVVAAGVPCPPFSIAGRQLGKDDERDLFPDAIRIIGSVKPRVALLENVRGFAGKRFQEYRAHLIKQLSVLGYESTWQVLNASDYGVPQLRPRFIMVAFRKSIPTTFHWPEPVQNQKTVGETLQEMMAADGWQEASRWAKRAAGIGPTIVGGSKKHGGPDLGPTRARQQWRSFGVDGRGIADAPPGRDFEVDGDPRLTLKMVALLQGFPEEWQFSGRKTSAYRQIGNALPPPVAMAVGQSIQSALASHRSPRQPLAVGQLRLIEKRREYAAD